MLRAKNEDFNIIMNDHITKLYENKVHIYLENNYDLIMNSDLMI
jgi:hypothetical protein